ncbi:MAG: M3 family oligoendopeptidase, partial [Bacilli bacterium]
YLESKQRELRLLAYNEVYSTYHSLINTFASTLSSYIKSSNFVSLVRGYENSLDASLKPNALNISVYTNLTATIKANTSLLHEYVALRKKMLKLDDLHMYDMYVSIVDDIELTFTYEEAQELIIDALSILGEEYISIVKEAFDNRWIDQVENVGKRSGAYSGGSYETLPYILLNWQDTLSNVFTLAHELGHSVHSYYTRKNQPFIYGRYSIFLAEIASTTNENILIDYLLKKYDDPKIKAYLINYYLDGFKGTVFRQTQFAAFEEEIYQASLDGAVLTSTYLSERYLSLNKLFYGNDVIHDEYISYEWARIPHFYYDFYVFMYASGFSAASALSEGIIMEKPNAVKNYLNFLKAGSSKEPLEVIKEAGLDISDSKYINDALLVFKKRLEQLKELI